MHEDKAIASIGVQSILVSTLALAIGVVDGVPPAAAAGVGPSRIGQCVASSIAKLGNRLDTPRQWSVVILANGVPQVSYEQEPGLDRSRVGDPVITCLVFIPKGCPPGDDRGKIYRTTNRRTAAHGVYLTLPIRAAVPEYVD